MDKTKYIAYSNHTDIQPQNFSVKLNNEIIKKVVSAKIQVLKLYHFQ